MSKSVNESHRGLAGNAADADLMAALHATSGEALGTLLRRYTRLVHRVASGILRDAGEAEDVTQEVFFEIYRKAHLYDPARGSVRVWLLQYAYHRSLRRRDALRRRAAWRGESLETMEVRPVAARPVHTASGLSPDECRWVIRAGLAELPPRQRLTLELACFQGLTLADVAAHLRVSLGSARHYYYRGLARLRLWARRTSAASIHADKDERERQTGVEVRRV
jgi:RNA polymerase sigma-70 factor, ECF subfamily